MVRSERLLVALTIPIGASIILQSGCGGDKPTSPQNYVNVSGSWSGYGSDNSGPGDLDMTLSQTKQAVTGTFSAHSGLTSVGGSVNGTLNGYQFKGSLAATYSGCQIAVNFEATVSDTIMLGTYSGTNSCSGPVTDGSLTLIRR